MFFKLTDTKTFVTLYIFCFILEKQSSKEVDIRIMTDYVDGYTFPIKRIHLEEYKRIAQSVAMIWKEYGALAYIECVGDDLHFEGTRNFPDTLSIEEGETIIFGWITFESRESRDKAHQQVAADSRMEKLVAPLMDKDRLIFDAQKMVFGGFQSMISK